MIDGGKATAVRLRNGHIIRAKKAVVSNASLWDTVKLIAKEHVPADMQKRNKDMPMNPSFMHLHVGFDATGAPHFSHTFAGRGDSRLGRGSASHHREQVASSCGLRAERRSDFDPFRRGRLLRPTW